MKTHLKNVLTVSVINFFCIFWSDATEAKNLALWSVCSNTHLNRYT